MRVNITKPRNTVHLGTCGHINKADAFVTYNGQRATTYARRALDESDPDYRTCGACSGRLEDGLLRRSRT